MTTSFRLSADGLTTFEFLSGAIRLAEGWTIGETLTESWTFIGQGTAAVMRAELADLTALLNNAREWATDPLRSGPTWLEFHADGEPDSRRRLVLDGGREFLNRTGINPLMTNQRVAIEIKLEFAYPWWEKEGETTVFDESIGCNGGTLTIPAGGDMDGRIARLVLSDLVAASTLTKFWIGMRPVLSGTSDLNPVWSCSLGMDAVDSSNTADTDCVSGNRKTVTFGTTTALAQRNRILYSVIGSGNFMHLTGRYLVLLRYKLPTTTSAVAIEMRYGYVNDTLAIQDAVIVTSGAGMSNYGVVELGMVQFPAGSPRGLAATMDDCVIDIYAERITGSTQLYLAELILIPADHLLRLTGANVNNGTAETTIYTHEDEEVTAFGVASGFATGTARPEPENWRIPYKADSILVLVGARSSTNLAEADSINLALYAHKCWQSYST